jgi:predicted nucleic acid-binding protein
MTSVYLDASVLVPLFKEDVFTNRAQHFFRSNKSDLIISDFAAAEFASALGRYVRLNMISVASARIAFSTFDAWAAQMTNRVRLESSDAGIAETFLRRLDLPLRTPDALNIAIAQRTGAVLATFDIHMAGAARALAVPVADIP